MEHLPTVIPAWLAALGVLWLLAGLTVYARLLARTGRAGGSLVSGAEYGLPDLLMCAAMAVWFGATIVKGFGSQDTPVTQHDIRHGAAAVLMVLAVIWVFLDVRGIRPWRQFGLFRRNPLVCALAAAGLVLAAFPLLLVVTRLWMLAPHGPLHAQKLVEFLIDADRRGDKRALYETMGLAVVVAPVAEEVIFRGYFYGVLKKWLGGAGAAVVSGAIFAAMHVNVPSLAPLFVLALCLTVAYEAAGSLLVTIFMHALFNLTMLAALLNTARMRP